MSETCGKLVRCWDFSFRPCLRPRGHNENGNPHRHNPFSNSMPPSTEEVNMRKPIRVEDDELEVVLAS